ncbi:SDR family NAD(P)-dependent oxidoreductase [Paenibacillus glycanilyticus]|uniref:Oxidoreductase n=1 Tax=Paenibacillus glycanilyticus TaxID=126569 RepID=A0ABQ6GKV8_9BACL|nr:SDR family NAD(P)-dependent oxidoreductase [Paenibacillus glycanilyticus]GLX70705.1 oxidoreductase [Paenibacillus glycanilyticus]
MKVLTVQSPIQSHYGAKTTAKEILKNMDLSGKNVIVTGGYSGVGLETTKALANAGANVFLPVRSMQKTEQLLKGLPSIERYPMDLMVPSSIDAFSSWFLEKNIPLHILINNGGIMNPPLRRDSRGYESQFSTNHLGHFQLTARLFPALKLSNGARVISISSRAQRLGGVLFDDPHFEHTEYNGMRAYAQSKSANVLFAVWLDLIGQEQGVRAFAVHPGLIPTTNLGIRKFENDPSKLKRGIARIIPAIMRALHVTELINISKRARKMSVADEFKTIQQGAATSIWCAVSSDLEGMGGVYCEDCNIAYSVPADSNEPYGIRPWAIDPLLAEKLWRLSEELTGVAFKI